MHNFRYFFGRLCGAIPTLLAIVTITFFLIRLAPGGPFDQEQTLPADVLANLNAAYGLNEPMWRQYLHYIGGLAHGDFGPSFRYKDFTVTELIAQGLPVSATLGAIAILIATVAGVAVGTFAALHHKSIADHASMALAVAGIAIPSFVLLPALGLLFGVTLHWLPVAGWTPGSAADLVLPVVTLSLPPLAYIARLTRGSMLEVLQSPYIRTAFAKGLPRGTIVMRHALRPALIPVASYLAPAVAMVMTGSLVVETIAGLPGIGRYLVQGALNRDYTLVLGMVIVYSAILIFMGLVADAAIAWLDPRVRLEA
ncbi:MAG TPA: ABC transporter permease subunit [Steroidobacteraceae bacterium]|nr:ABC transporter permease subunit [Steroidobacteraceae bacterium]